MLARARSVAAPPPRLGPAGDGAPPTAGSQAGVPPIGPRPRWSISAKRSALAAFTRLGLINRIRDSRWRQRRLLILAYHSISIDDEHEWSGEYSMSAEQFESRLRALREGNYNVLSLDEGVRRLRAGTLPPRSVVLTFDDGLFDFRARALPLLQEYGYPATVYLTSYYAKKSEPIFGLLCSYFLWRGRHHGPISALPITGTSDSWDVSSERGRQRALDAIQSMALSAPDGTAERLRLLTRLAESVGLEYAEFRKTRVLSLLSEREVSELRDAGIDVQLHTHRHRMPGDRALFRREIEDNRAFLEPLRDSPASHFCYPSGFYTRESLEWLAECGILSATTCDPGLASTHSDPLLLPRVVDTSAVSREDFIGWLTGASALFFPRKASAHRARTG